MIESFPYVTLPRWIPMESLSVLHLRGTKLTRLWGEHNSKATSRQVPPEVAELSKKQLQKVAAKEAANARKVSNTVEKGPICFSLNVPAATTGGCELQVDVNQLDTVSSTTFASTALDLIKKKLQDSGVSMTSSSLSSTGPGSRTKIANDSTMAETGGKIQPSKSNKENPTVSDCSSDSDDEDSGPAKEEPVLQFKFKEDNICKSIRRILSKGQ